MASDASERDRVSMRPNRWACSVLVLGQGGVPINVALLQLAELVSRATVRLSGCLSREDWTYIFHALQGVACDPLPEPRWGVEQLRWELADAQAINQIGERVYAELPREKTDRLLKTAAGWSDLDAVAILTAVRLAVRVVNLDLATEDWWTVPYRTRGGIADRLSLDGNWPADSGG